jgi:hypothetical protein
MGSLPEIKRTVKTSRPVTGQEIGEALKKLSDPASGDQYEQRLLSDDDGDCRYNLELQSETPGRNVYVVIGDHESRRVKLDKEYSKVCLVTSYYSSRSGQPEKKYTPQDIVKSVEELRVGLEFLLRNQQN